MSDQTKVYGFIRANPGATTKAIRKGAGVRNERVTDILAAGTASGDLIMTAGFWGSRSYELAKTPDPKIPVPEQETPLQILVPEAGNHSPIPEALTPEPQTLVSVAQPVAPSLGNALLRPCPAFSGSRVIPTDSQDGKQSSESVNEPTAEPNLEPPPEPSLVELTRVYREAAEAGIRDAQAQLDMQHEALAPSPSADAD